MTRFPSGCIAGGRQAGWSRFAPAAAAAAAAAAPAAVVLAAALVVSPVSAQAQAADYPSRTVTIVVPTAPGGANDAISRILALRLTTALKQPVVVDNKPGANGAIASEMVARAKPDGHTLLLGYIATHGINPALQKLRYDPQADFEPIALVATSPTVLVVNAKLPVASAGELVALLKSKPGSLTYASAGNGTAPHLAAELFKLSAGVDMVHVPYKGSSPAIVDTIGGTTQLMFPSLYTAYPQIKAGKLKAIALAGDKRSALFKDLPTLAEQGVAKVAMSQWYALFAPARTPGPIVDRLNRELRAILADPAIEKKIEEQGAEVETGTPDQLRALVAAELVRWKAVIAAARITAD